MLRLRTLGTLDLRDADGAEIRAVLAQPRRLALLLYLAVAAPHGFHRRDRLLAMFWAEADTERARASLNRAIYFLRRELGQGVVISRGDGVGLDRERFWCDVAALDEALERGHLREVIELYRGDLLPGFFSSNASGFEEWLEGERARLRERVSESAWTLSEQEEKAGNLELATHWARHAAELAPFREIGVRRLLALLDRSGDRVGAAQAYKRFADVAADLELTPSPETRALIDGIRARDAAHSTGIAVGEVAAIDVLATPPNPSVSLDRPATPSLPRRRPMRWTLGISASVFALLAIAVVAARPREIDSTRIDVEAFENRTGDPAFDRLGRVATERVVSGLKQAALFKTVVLVEGSAWKPWRRISAEGSELATIRKLARAAITVTGAIIRRGDSLIVQAWINDARRSGSLWPVAPSTRAMSASDSAVDEVRARVLGGTAAIRNLSAARFFPIASSPPRFEAFEEYNEALQLKSQGRFDEATRHFRFAAGLDTTFTWPLVEAAWGSMFRAAPAPTDSLLAMLERARDRLVPLQRYLLDFMLATRADDWSAGYRSLREAAALAPERYSYAYAISASHVNRPRETVEILSRPGLDTLYRDSTQRYWNVLALAFHQLGEHRSEAVVARRARSYRLGSSHALMQEIRALAALRRTDAALVRLDTLASLPHEGWFIPPYAMVMVALELRAHSQPVASVEVLRRAAAWYRGRPAEEMATPLRRGQLAEVCYLLGNLDEAERLYRQLLVEDSTSDEYLGTLGTIAARRGQRAAAKAIAAKLEAREHFVPLPGSDALLWRAKIAALLGDRDRAMGLLTEAFGAAGTAQLHQDIDFDSLRDDPRFREFVRPKG